MRPVSPEVKLPEIEREVLADWERNKVFERIMQGRHSRREFAFYDGPPFANGLPHYGHLLQSAIKDTVQRYWTMRGFFVERRFGWDCHGVPVEFEVEKNLNLKGRTDILAMGIDKFNEACRASVNNTANDWQRTIGRIGRLVDWNDQYRTMDKNFMESVWWVVASLHKKGLLYRDFKVVPYSPRITAVLSNFEANQNYKDVQDPALTVKFKLQDENAFLLAWTTTPWTLISNLALCVGPEITYVRVRDKESGEIYYLAEARLSALYRQKGKDQEAPYEILAHIKGRDLAGRRYQPLFEYFAAERANAFVVLVDDYVSTDDGTGIVHQAPAYGEDDFRVCRRAGIKLVDPVDEEGRFKPEIREHAGQFVRDADKDIARRLKDSGNLLRNETVFHSYPFCERTDSPLIYKAIATWYVAVEKIKDRLVANNQKINWTPEHIRDGRMGKWLETARDWAISRNRYWGTPLPIWVSSEDESIIEVIGSVAELEAKCGQKVDDLHMHFIDKLTWPAPGGKGTMRRVPEVLDCWFESGSMPYAQLHYPFENKERFENFFPADFIGEAIDQTRGWFYTLSVLSTALFDKPAFKNCIATGMILAEDGKKMSKRLKNYTSPELLLDRFGADSVRLYMLNSPVLKAGELAFKDVGVRDTTRAVILPLWNAYSFLSTYANLDGWLPSAALAKGEAPKVESELDRWIISRFQSLCQSVHKEMEQYRLYMVVPPVLDFIEDLTNWYIRLSRRRFWGEAGAAEPAFAGQDDAEAEIAVREKTPGNRADTESAYQTLFYVLQGFSRVFAPFAPFLADKIYQDLLHGCEQLNSLEPSVHLTEIPQGETSLVDLDLEERMNLLRRVANMGRSLRAKHKIKTRQALPSMLVITRNASDRRHILSGESLLKGELNLKQIDFSTDESRYVNLSLKPNLKTLGKRLGKDLNAFKEQLEGLSKDQMALASLLGDLEKQGHTVAFGQQLTEADLLIDRSPKDGRLCASEAGVTILLDTKLSEELILEGLAREVINRVQRQRKDTGLKVSDRISLQVAADDTLALAVARHKEHIAHETLAERLDIRTFSKDEASMTVYDIDGKPLGLALKAVSSSGAHP